MCVCVCVCVYMCVCARLHFSLSLILDGEKGSDSPSIPALGRPFRLGDFYNIDTDQLVLGKSLWSYEDLQKKIVNPIHRTAVKVTVYDRSMS